MRGHPTKVSVRFGHAGVLALMVSLSACAPKVVPPATTPTTAPSGDAWAGTPSTGDAPWGSETPAATGPNSAEPTTAASAATTEAWTRGFSAGEIRQLDDAVAMLDTRDSGKAQAALERLQPLAKEHPDAAVVWYNMGVAAQLTGNLDEARKNWTRATEVDSSFSRAWLNLGVLSAWTGRMDMALANFQNGTKYNPNDVELRVAAIGALRSLKRHDEAIAAARQGLAINSRAVDLYTRLAGVYLDTNRVDLARFVLEKALIEIPAAARDAELHASLGEVYRRLDYSGDAITEFRKALEIDPSQLAALQYLGSYYLDNRAYTEAAPLWERVVQQVPGAASARSNLAIAYRGQGRYDEAIRLYQESLRADPQNPEPYRNLAVLYGDYQKNYDAAVNAIDQYRKAGGGPPAELDAWVAALRKDQKRAEDKRKRDEERKKKEMEAPAAPVETPQQAPTQPTPPTDPAPGTDPNPWGGGG